MDTQRSTRIGWRPTFWIMGAVVVWTAAVIDCTIRDAISGLHILFYATPPVVLAVLSFAVVCLGRIRVSLRSKWINRATLLLSVASFVQWGVIDFRRQSLRDSTPDAIRLVFWNVGRGHFAGGDRIAEVVRSLDADVLAFVEATSDEMQSREFWSRHLPDHAALPLHNGMLLLVKGEAVTKASGSLEHRGDFRHLGVTIKGTRFDLIIADIASSPHRSRQAPLSKLFRLMQQQTTIPTLVAGDFNTPPNSVWFDRWRPEWQRAWEAGGHGFQPTWPQLFPVLTLDHVWGNGHVTFEDCTHGWSSASDHRPVIVSFTTRK